MSAILPVADGGQPQVRNRNHGAGDRAAGGRPAEADADVVAAAPELAIEDLRQAAGIAVMDVPQALVGDDGYHATIHRSHHALPGSFAGHQPRANN